MASKMAEKKKSTSRNRMADPKTSTSAREESASSVKTKEQPVRDERKEQEEQKELKGQKGQKEQPKQESKAIRKEQKGSSSLLKRFRNNSIGRFTLDAYHELRYKVTWPTFQEARNMTIAVVIISLVIGAILAAADFGLYHLFLLIVRRGS